MTTSVKQFDAMRLNRDAESAGRAFGFEEVDANVAEVSRTSAWIIRLGCFAVLAACVIYGLA